MPRDERWLAASSLIKSWPKSPTAKGNRGGGRNNNLGGDKAASAAAPFAPRAIRPKYVVRATASSLPAVGPIRRRLRGVHKTSRESRVRSNGSGARADPHPGR